MKNLVYKELRLSINKFFYIMPVLLSALFIIPQWFFTLVFMYMFWITVPQVFSSYLANEDYNFTSMLPVTKKDIVQSKIIALVVIELIHLAVGVVFAIIHNHLWGVWNFSLDANIAFFGVGFLMYGIFNIVFFPYYFKSGYFFGKPTIAGTIITIIYAGIIEYGVIKYQFMRDLFEGNITSQLIVLIVGIILSIILTITALQISQKRYEKIDR